MHQDSAIKPTTKSTTTSVLTQFMETSNLTPKQQDATSSTTLGKAIPINLTSTSTPTQVDEDRTLEERLKEYKQALRCKSVFHNRSIMRDHFETCPTTALCSCRLRSLGSFGRNASGKSSFDLSRSAQLIKTQNPMLN